VSVFRRFLISTEKDMLRSSSILGIGLAVAALAAFQVTGCGDSGGGGTPGTGGSTGTAGSTGAGGTSASGVAGTTGSGGDSSTGTAGSATTGSAGSSTTGSGGTSTTGTGGSTGAGGSGAFGQPLCSGTVSKGSACTATDAQLCYKTCGPQSKGVKSETCTNGAYVEMDGCSFDPTMDYSCYKLPTAANTMCPAADMPPQASMDCTVDVCKPCNTTGGLPGGMYKDSGGTAKVGYCVCQPMSASGRRTWSCASDTAWPCTASGGAPGCQ
jgi:hypothetical protein